MKCSELLKIPFKYVIEIIHGSVKKIHVIRLQKVKEALNADRALLISTSTFNKESKTMVEKLRIEKESALKRLIEWEQGEEARLTKLLDEEYNSQRKELQNEIEKKVQEELCRIQKLFQDLGDEKTRLVKTNIQEFLKSEFQRLH